jgi:hypothetical protein
MTKAIDRNKVNLSGSNTRLEYTLKYNGIKSTAAIQPASINLLQKALSLVVDRILFFPFSNLRPSYSPL